MFLTETGDWEKHKVYDTESEANTALDGFFVQSQEWGPQKVGSSKKGVKTVRLQVVSRFERDFFGREGAVECVGFYLFKAKRKK